MPTPPKNFMVRYILADLTEIPCCFFLTGCRQGSWKSYINHLYHLVHMEVWDTRLFDFWGVVFGSLLLHIKITSFMFVSSVIFKRGGSLWSNLNTKLDFISFTGLFFSGIVTNNNRVRERYTHHTKEIMYSQQHFSLDFN